MSGKTKKNPYMLQAYIVYIFSLILMFSVSIIKYPNNKLRKKGILFSILIFCALMGARFNVGVDYMAYFDWYQECVNFGMGSFVMTRETGYAYLNLLLAYFNMHYFFLFFISLLLPLFMIYKYYKDSNELRLMPWFFLCYFAFLLASALNIVRHFMAFGFFVYSLKFIVNRNIYQYLITLLLGYLFHKSILVCIPLYFIANKDLFPKRLPLSIVVMVLFLIGWDISSYLFSKLDPIITMLNYDHYAEAIDDYSQHSRGLGVLLKAILTLLMIYYSDKLKGYFGKNYLVLYNITVIGFIVYPVFSSNIIFARMIYYFDAIRAVLASYTLFYLFRSYRNRIDILVGIGFVAACLILILNAITVGSSLISPFSFFWQR